MRTVSHFENAAAVIPRRRTKLSLSSKIARENIYIDDLLSGADTEVEAKSIIIEIQNLLKSGGFILRKWSSSHPKVLQDLDTSLLASKPIHSLGDEESKQRVLGLIWNLKTDSIQVKVVHEEIVKTKIQLLSVIAQIFDPLGLFSPSVITLKIMLQELWKSKAFGMILYPHPFWKIGINSLKKVNI
ncbi:uncharacterized protein TNCV_3617101 [Trichonephila clavipes]|nr:uncharacterized protein TNCV_3617101 [Trichonephila clavipes]